MQYSLTHSHDDEGTKIVCIMCYDENLHQFTMSLNSCFRETNLYELIDRRMNSIVQILPSIAIVIIIIGIIKNNNRHHISLNFHSFLQQLLWLLTSPPKIVIELRFFCLCYDYCYLKWLSRESRKEWNVFKHSFNSWKNIFISLEKKKKTWTLG